MAPIGEAVFATLLMNDGYLPGAMVLGHSLRDRGAKAKLICLVTIDSLSSETIEELRTVFDDIVPVQRIRNPAPGNLFVMNRPDLISTFTKIELWRQTQYKRIVYLDADMVALRAPNELLKMDTSFAAVPDIGWPDCFNSGVMVLNPSMGDYYSLLALAQRGISFDGADQGLLNMHFTDWERLSFSYNCTPSGNYQYVPAYKHFQSSISAIHFIGPDKPWSLGRENRFNTGVYGELLARWWTVYDRHYRQRGAYYSGQSTTAPKKVQDYVHGEEALYGYSSSQPQQQRTPSVQIEPPPQEQLDAPKERSAEAPLGDTASPATQALQKAFQPTPTVEQRRFSASHNEWDPSKAPPPTDSKPEAANFPTTHYDMSREKKLFQPPHRYPDAPRDMYYQVPEKRKEQDKPKPIFPWEGKAPKPTRVFAEPSPPSPPPEPAPPEPEPVTLPEPAAISSPPEAASPANISSPDPWAGFQSRVNAWDEIPEIESYMQRLQGPRKAKIQVLHHIPPSNQNATSPPTGDQRERRSSLKLTDFPTEVERPSLPVTPAPIRRPSFWGAERDQQGNLPAAEGVPEQEEWVRQFQSYPTPKFASDLPPLLSNVNGVMVMRCQYCGKQNPIAKLEELHRKQSEVLTSPEVLQQHKDLPTRQMPGSQSREEVQAKEEKATSPTEPFKPKPILKTPSFEIPKENSADLAPDADTARNTAANVAPTSLDPPTTAHMPTADQAEDTALGETPPAQSTATVKG